jgi:hypothetical protein
MKRAILLLAALAAGPAAALEPSKLIPVACGVRHTLWLEHYSAQLYLPAGTAFEALSDPDKPKMLKMRVLNTFLMPPEIPRKWREALQPVLDAHAMKRLQDEYDGLQSGDTVVVTYQPQRGIALSINERAVASAGGHRAIDALLAAWADDAPLEKKLSATVSRNRCA